MLVAKRIAQTFSLTILNAVTGSIAIGASYYIHKNPDAVSPLSHVTTLSEKEDDYIRSKFRQFGIDASSEKIKFFTFPYNKTESRAIGIVGSSQNAHIYIPEPYLKGPNSTFAEAYPNMLESDGFQFEFNNSTLVSVNQNEHFQQARKSFMHLEPVFPESYEEMEMNMKSTCYKLKFEAEKDILRSGVLWISLFTVIHQLAAFVIKPVNSFPLLPCAFGIGGMVYRGWKLQEECAEYLCESPETSAVLVHQTNAEILYNQERKKFLGVPQRWLISSKGNDWSEALLGGPITRKLAVCQANLLQQVYGSPQTTSSDQKSDIIEELLEFEENDDIKKITSES